MVFRMIKFIIFLVGVGPCFAEYYYPKPDLHLQQEVTGDGGYLYPKHEEVHHHHHEDDHHHVSFFGGIFLGLVLGLTKLSSSLMMKDKT